MPDGQPDPVARFFGGALLAIGFLMMALCGGCGAVFLLFTADGPSPTSTILQAAIVIGGPPTLIGGLLIWLGFRLRRRAKQPPSETPPG